MTNAQNILSYVKDLKYAAMQPFEVLRYSPYTLSGWLIQIAQDDSALFFLCAFILSISINNIPAIASKLPVFGR